MAFFNGVFLDDERYPVDPYWMEYPKGVLWNIIRTYDDFCTLVEDKIDWTDPPKIFSFDHDIACFDRNGKEQDGYDCLKFLIVYCDIRDIPLPQCVFHSKNGVGTGNMVSYYNNYLAMKHIDKERFL